MGQFALGLRSLLIKSAVFVVMAALLAWALGGTLWPKPVRKVFPAIQFIGRDLHWRLTVLNQHSNKETGYTIEPFRWELLWTDNQGDERVVADELWYEVAKPLRVDFTLYVAGRAVNRNGAWQMSVVDRTMKVTERHLMPDRLAVEQQLQRLKSGLPLQDIQTIERQRQAVLDPSALDSP